MANKPVLSVVSSRSTGVPLNYAHTHTPLYVPNLGNLKSSFSVKQVNPSDNRVTSLTLLPNGLVEVVSPSKDGQSMTFYSPATNFTVLVPA